ncbi:MAG TPA: hypothetical protein VF368_06670, partial [Gemmatimonadaceae bacterium]
TLGGTVTVAAVAGVATFSNISVNKAATGYTLIANSGTLTPATTTPFDIAAGTATQLVVTTQPSNGIPGIALAPIVITAQDSFGNVATTFTGPVTLALSANPGGSTLAGTLTVAAVGGVATFTSISLNKAATGYTLSASSGALTPVTTAPFAITAGAATQLVVTTQPTNGTASIALSPVVITAKDNGGNVATTFAGSVTLAFGANPSGATLGGTLTVNAVAGVAIFSTLTVSKNGTGFTLAASSPGLTGVTTSPFNISAASPATLVFTVAPAANTAAGTAFVPALAVTAEDALGNVTAGFTGAVTLTLGANPGGSTLAGTLTVSAVGGVATFNNVSLSKAATGYTLTAAATGLTRATSPPFAIIAGTATQLVMTAQPANGTAGVALAPIGITAEDAYGNVANAFTGPVTLALNANPGGSTLAGTLTVSAVGGVATFNSISLNKAATGYTLNASSGALTPVTTTSFNITAGTATHILVSAQPANGTAGIALAPIGITAEDSFGNIASAFTGAVTLALNANPGGSTVAGTLTVSAAAGVATFSDISLNKAASGYTLNASSGALTPVTTNAFSISAGLASQLVVTAQPANGTAGITLAPIGITAEDSFGNIASTFTGPVTLAFNANPGGSTLGGTLTVAAVGGVATFTDISLNKVATGYTLRAASGSLTSATTTSFNIGAGPAASIAINGGNSQTARVNTTLATPLSVIVRDAGGNAVAGVTVQFAILTGGGHVSVASAVSNATGVASTSWTLGSTVGKQTVSATATGLTGSPLTFSATAQSGER